MRVLITGVAGFVGRHLATHVLALGEDSVWGLVRPGNGVSGLDDRVQLVTADLTDRRSVDAAIQDARPDAIYHLAAQSSVARSLSDPLATIVNNVSGQINLLEAVLSAGLDAKILIVGSNEEYGLTRPDELPVAETKELRPINPYAVSKVAQDLLGHQYFASRRMRIVRVRPFNHTGPGQTAAFVAPAFARQLAEMELGLREPVIRVGYLDGQRDFTDVRDVVRGYQMLVQKGADGEVYNLGSGRPRTVRSILDGLIAASSAQPRVETDPALLRPAEVPVQYADCRRIRAATGWEPKIPFETTLADILEDWRAQVRP